MGFLQISFQVKFMQMKIALCIDIAEFQQNKILDKNWARKFPGALWVSVFAELAKEKGLLVVTGDIALSNVQARRWRAEDILVIQELDAWHGRKLISLGAKPAVLTGFESPIFAYPFYDQLPKVAPAFQNRVLFSGAFKTFHASAGHNYQAYFPNFSLENIEPFTPWDERGFLVMVAANKHWQEPFRIPFYINPKRYLGWARAQWRKLSSKTRPYAVKNELHSKRLEAIEYFGSLKLLGLFGPGWTDPCRLPMEWRERMGSILQNLNPHPCDDKMKTISGYKFALCFENISYPGYITEKIIDCFVAGVIPIYLGAPDILDFVPKEAFINLREFDSWTGLHNYLKVITEEEALKIITAGREFLYSAQGRLHSFEGFAQFIFNLICGERYAK